jgi:hypothetical protein
METSPNSSDAAEPTAEDVSIRSEVLPAHANELGLQNGDGLELSGRSGELAAEAFKGLGTRDSAPGNVHHPAEQREPAKGLADKTLRYADPSSGDATSELSEETS